MSIEPSRNARYRKELQNKNRAWGNLKREARRRDAPIAGFTQCHRLARLVSESAAWRSIMTRSLRVLAVSLAFILTCAVSAGADVITFENASVDRLDLNSPTFEGAFTYSALATFFDDEPASLNDRVDFVRGGNFDFLRLDWRTINVASSDRVVVEGYLAAALVNSLTLSSSSLAFVALSGFGGPIDRLSLRVIASGSNAMLLDNLNLARLTEVPEPATFALLGAGLAAVGLTRRRSRVRACAKEQEHP